mgnify:CR=1 FL=1
MDIAGGHQTRLRAKAWSHRAVVLRALGAALAACAPAGGAGCTWREGGREFTLVLGVGVIERHEHVAGGSGGRLHAARESTLGVLVQSGRLMAGWRREQQIEVDPRADGWIEAVESERGDFVVRTSRAGGACPWPATRR